jgi:hypothetical protein
LWSTNTLRFDHLVIYPQSWSLSVSSMALVKTLTDLTRL